MNRFLSIHGLLSLLFLMLCQCIIVSGQNSCKDTVQFSINKGYIDKIVLHLERTDSCSTDVTKPPVFCNYLRIVFKDDFVDVLNQILEKELYDAQILPNIQHVVCTPFRYNDHKYLAQKLEWGNWYRCETSNNKLNILSLITGHPAILNINCGGVGGTWGNPFPCYTTTREIWHNIQGVVNSNRDKQQFPSGVWRADGRKDIIKFNANATLKIRIDPSTVGKSLNEQKFIISYTIENICGDSYLCPPLLNGPYNRVINREIFASTIDAAKLANFPLLESLSCTDIAFDGLIKVTKVLVVHACIIRKL